MPELLLELFSEEIPARMQSGAAEQLRDKAESALKESGFSYKEIKTYVTPRRLVLVVDDLPIRQQDVRVEHKGPHTNAAPAAIQGFLKKTGLSENQLEKRATDKGECYFATIEQKGKETSAALPSILLTIIENFHWPKSMRWGSGAFRWVRPLKNIACVFDGKILPLNIHHLSSNDLSFGHRFLAPDAFKIESFSQYRDELKKRYVLLDAAERKAEITKQAEKLISAKGFALHKDEALLEEVAGLAEWPVAMLGDIEERFLKLPQEVLMTSMRSHQKYFSVVDSKGKIAPHYILITNNPKPEAENQIKSGNSRVLRARLSDAEFFYAQDKKQPLVNYLSGLESMVFHAKLGTMAERVSRIVSLASFVAPFARADLEKTKLAAKLAKADLSTQMVGEFPELQGIMGGYYTTEGKEIAAAIREHYSPLGPSDYCPKSPISVAVALADKADILAGMFAVDETPTGSKDPFALRRAALGIIRLVLENEISLPLKSLFAASLRGYGFKNNPTSALLSFFEERLKATLKAKGTRHDLIAAVFALGEDNLILVVSRVAALNSFITSDDGINLLAAYKRAANILSIEEKKDKKTYGGEPSLGLAREQEEKELLAALEVIKKPLAEAIAKNNYDDSMKILSGLRKPVDAFFEKVKVNSDDAKIRENRLKILALFREQYDIIAKFGLIEG